jgi:hypothetical protein
VILFRCEIELSFEQALKPVSAFREHLVSVPIRRRHHTRDRDDVVIRHVLVEKVAHRIDENHSGRSPTQRLAEFFGNQT